MRFFRFLCLSFLLTVVACGTPTRNPPPAGTNIVAVFGAIHGQHRTSKDYSHDVLKKAIVKFNPDIVMVELPPDRFTRASENYKRFGEVRESRADDFPELIDVVFPLREELGFEMIPTAAWTQKIADDRRAVTEKIKSDPARQKDWAQNQAVAARYNKAVAGRSDDPAFVHSPAYDAAVKARQETYESLFGDDLGPGGWKAINAAHFALMEAALEKVQGQEKRILILFGAWHKYKILEGLETSSGVKIEDARQYF